MGDVEILYVPIMEEQPLDFFATYMVSLADEEIGRMLLDGTLTKRPSKTGSTSWGDKNKLAIHRDGLAVDLFRTTDGAWWNYLVCRTGPADSNKRIAVTAQRMGYTWKPYSSGFKRLSDDGMIAMNSEAAVFEFVGLPYEEPASRV